MHTFKGFMHLSFEKVAKQLPLFGNCHLFPNFPIEPLFPFTLETTAMYLKIKPLIAYLSLIACFALTSSPLHSQTQAEAAENVLVFQKNDKEWVGQTGDYLTIKVYNRFRGFNGKITAITDSTVTMRRRTFRIADLKRATLGKRKLHLAALSLAVIGLLGPYLVIGFIALANAIVGPPSILNNNPTFWRRLRNGTMIATWTALIASVIANIAGHKRFNLKKHKLKVEKRKRPRP